MESWLLMLTTLWLLLASWPGQVQGQQWRWRRLRREKVHCQPVEVPMCKGMVGYAYTHLPNSLGHRTQAEVYWALQPFWPYMDLGCSKNLRPFLCALHLPKCDPDTREVSLPCRKMCRKAQVRCSKPMQEEGLAWPRQLSCGSLLLQDSDSCMGPVKEKKQKKYKYVSCVKNEMSMCSSVPYPLGSLPNMFLQVNQRAMDIELQQYRELVKTGCSVELPFFLCGVFMPYCLQEVDADIPFGVPCRDVCERVYNQCYPHYQRLTGGLPWPGKFHCHRYPEYRDPQLADNTTIPCVQSPNSIRRRK